MKFNAEQQQKLKKFTGDPDWYLIEELLESYIEPLKRIDNIDTDKPSEAVHAQITGRKEAVTQIEKFLNQTRLSTKISNEGQNARPFK